MNAGHAEAAAHGDIVVPLHSRRRKRRLLAQRLQHVIAAAGLFFGGMQSLSAGAEGLERILAVAGMLTAGLLIGAFAREVRGVTRVHGEHRAHGVDWMDIFAAGVLLAEAAAKWRLRGHIWRPETLAAIATLGIGLFHGRLAARNERRRSMRLTGDHLVIGARHKFVKAFTARWDEIADISIGDREAVIRTHKGKTRKVNLADLENAAAVRAALVSAQMRRTASDHERLTP
jgi:hypothetical protein